MKINDITYGVNFVAETHVGCIILNPEIFVKTNIQSSLRLLNVAKLLVCSYFKTYGMNLYNTCCSNHFGPYHFPKKLILLIVTNAKKWEMCIFLAITKISVVGWQVN